MPSDKIRPAVWMEQEEGCDPIGRAWVHWHDYNAALEELIRLNGSMADMRRGCRLAWTVAAGELLLLLLVLIWR